MNTWHRWRKILVDTARQSLEKNITVHSAAIAFYTIFSIAPILLIIIALTGFIYGQTESVQFVRESLDTYLEPRVAETIYRQVENTFRFSSNLFATLTALITLLFGSTAALSQLKYSLNEIWNVHAGDVNGFRRFFMTKLLSLLLILVIATLFLLTMLLEAGWLFFQDWIGPAIPDFAAFLLTPLSMIPGLLVSLLFFLIIFRILPDIELPIKELLIGSAVTTLLFTAGKYLVGLYFSASGIVVTYRAAGAFVIFLIWMYYNVQTVLAGAIFTRVYSSYRPPSEDQ
ncbi:MAG: YihY/virulence factor BrkB family protein [Balneolaceae bacterium]|nr:YihY/virulence factor BrkB family protein [Balneolaceae bacterium]